MTRGIQTSALVLEHKVPTWIGKRMRVDFWLRIDHAPDLEVLDIIAWFKGKGLFRGSAMTGLRVMFAYYHNDIEAICTLLPNLKGLIGQGNPPPPPDTSGVEHRLENIERMLLERPTLPASPIVAAPATTGKQLTGKTFALPAFDDDEEDMLTLKLAKNTSNTANENFLRAFSSLSQ